MHIDQYRFGHLDIEGHSYDADVIIFPGHVQERWWRQEGHRLAREDLDRVLAEKPELLVVGTGYYGRMQVPEETLDALRSAGIDVRVEKTGSAVEEFNRLQRECALIVAALHLTCWWASVASDGPTYRRSRASTTTRASGERPRLQSGRIFQPQYVEVSDFI